MPEFPVTEYDVQALVDRQLRGVVEKKVRDAIAASPALRAYHLQLLIQKQLLAEWWAGEIRKKKP